MSKYPLMVGQRVKTPSGYGTIISIHSDKVVVELDYMYHVTYKKAEVTPA